MEHIVDTAMHQNQRRWFNEMQTFLKQRTEHSNLYPNVEIILHCTIQPQNKNHEQKVSDVNICMWQGLSNFIPFQLVPNRTHKQAQTNRNSCSQTGVLLFLFFWFEVKMYIPFQFVWSINYIRRIKCAVMEVGEWRRKKNQVDSK